MDDENDLPSMGDVAEAPETENTEVEQEVAKDEPKVSDEADETEDNDAEDNAVAVQVEPVKAGRAERRIQALDSRAKEAEAKAKELQEQLALVTARQRQEQASMDAAKEQEFLASIEPHERVAYEANKKIEQMRSEINRIQFQAADSVDRNGFVGKISSDKALSAYIPKVEQELQTMRAKGLNAPRQDILAYMLGRDLLEKGSKKDLPSADKKAAADRVAATKGKTVSARNDTSMSRGGKTLEDKLANVQL